MFGLGLLKGLGVTMRHFLQSYIHDRRPWEKRYSEEWLEKHQDIDGKGLFTIQYPEQRRKVPEHFRFFPMLVYEREANEPRCTACGICARVCPPQCIWIQRATDDKGRPKAKPAGFWIDATICMGCGSCSEYCPFDAIKMNQRHEMITTDRDRDMFYDMAKLLQPVEYYARLHPSDYRAEEEERQAKARAKQEAEEAKKATEQAKKAAAVVTQPAAPPPVASRSQETVTVAAPAKPDDLKIVEGIGPKIASVLQAAGINTFAQLAAAEVDRIRQILETADPKLLNLANPTTWPKQAKLAAEGKWDALQKWQDKLKAGQG
jgi:NADH-quinone oxidoreductase subunit I